MILHEWIDCIYHKRDSIALSTKINYCWLIWKPRQPNPSSIFSLVWTIVKMTLTSQLAPDIPNFHNLALFICHLFIDGSFRTGHILYDPNIFDGDFITQIDSICPHSIPWESTDIREPSLVSWTNLEHTDHILQLIFLDETNLTKDISSNSDLFTFYRLFIFPSGNETNIKNQLNAIQKTKETSDSNSLILHHSAHNSSVRVHLIPINDTKIDGAMRPIYVQNQQLNPNHENLYELTFGVNDRRWQITINNRIALPCNETVVRETVLLNPYHANFFSSKLKAEYINFTTPVCKIDSLSRKFQMVQHKQKKFYKELATEYDSIDSENM